MFCKVTEIKPLKCHFTLATLDLNVFTIELIMLLQVLNTVEKSLATMTEPAQLASRVNMIIHLKYCKTVFASLIQLIRLRLKASIN